MPAGTALKKVFDCAGLGNELLLAKGGGDANPFTNLTYKKSFDTIWGDKKLFGAMAYTTLTEKSGPAHISLGGYDYHNGTRSLGNTKDLEAGELIGQILATADYFKKPVFIMVTSDGAAGSPPSDDLQVPWTTDFGRGSAVYMLSYNPNKRPTTSTNQLGTLLEAQAVDSTYILGNSPERATLGVFANYCSLIGRMDLLDKLPRKPFNNQELKDVLAFHKG